MRRGRAQWAGLCLLSALVAAAPQGALGQAASRIPGPAAPPVEPLPFLCPMDPDIRSARPGTCSRCGMRLVLGLPTPAEYPVLLRSSPRAVVPGERAQLEFEVLQPGSGRRQTEFEEVHVKLFHLFWVSHDLSVFRHEHPALGADGVFRIEAVFEQPGTYRLMGDFFPSGGTPQMYPMTLTTRGFEGALEEIGTDLEEDLSPKRGENLTVSLRTEPRSPLAGQLTLLFFELSTARRLQKFLGAWAHMLAVKDDLVTMIHGHPTFADGGKRIQMNVIFPQPGSYRVWVQVQRRRKVSTVPFTIAVSDLPR